MTPEQEEEFINPFMAVQHYIEDNNINPNRVWGHNKMYE
jgi:hypothetical protein